MAVLVLDIARRDSVQEGGSVFIIDNPVIIIIDSRPAVCLGGVYPQICPEVGMV